jgi:FMN phosphatase YigB (HAD superfamily)
MIDAAIFDLGNVLLAFDHHLIEQRVADAACGATDAAACDETAARMRALAVQFEHGAMAPAAFIAACIALPALDGRLAADDFRLLWCDIFWPRRAMIALVTRLARRMPLVMLSNTNALHIDWARERHPEVFTPFTATVFSHEIGCAKPDPAAFDAALARAGTTADRCLYVDDLAAHVDAATSRGLRAIQHVSAAGVTGALRLLGVDMQDGADTGHKNPQFSLRDIRTGVLPC